MSTSSQTAEARMRDLLYDFRRYLEQLKEEGVETLESASPEAPARSRPSSRPAAPVRTSRTPASVSPPPSRSPSPAPPPAADRENTAGRRDAYRGLLEEIRKCGKCPLAQTRQKVVPGEGGNRKRVLFIGEGPGADEDRIGRPFVGRSGQLLDKILASISLSREDIYITNIVKCRPPGNRDPLPEEVIACWSYLETQIKLLQPRLIVTLGLPATRTLLESSQSMARLRGRFHDYQGIPLLPTYHPAFILRAYTPDNRKKAWEDIKMVRDFLSGSRE